MEPDRPEQGFSLIELLVVVLVIAILMTIAIPTYAGARVRAQDRAAQSTARNAFVAARISYAGTTSYGSDASAMADVEPSLAWTATSLTDASPPHAAFMQVSADRQSVIVGARAKNGHCFFIEDVMAAPGTTTRYFSDTAAGSDCTPPAFGDPQWSPSW